MGHRISLQRAWKLDEDPESRDAISEIKAARTFHGLPDLPDRPIILLHIASIDGLKGVFLNEQSIDLVKLDSSSYADISGLIRPFNRLELAINPNNSTPFSTPRDFEVWLEIIETK